MIGDTDLTNLDGVDRLRESLARLPASSYDRVFTREEALRLVDGLRDALRAIALD